jgi:hypothetical protein
LIAVGNRLLIDREPGGPAANLRELVSWSSSVEGLVSHMKMKYPRAIGVKAIGIERRPAS